MRCLLTERRQSAWSELVRLTDDSLDVMGLLTQGVRRRPEAAKAWRRLEALKDQVPGGERKGRPSAERTSNEIQWKSMEKIHGNSWKIDGILGVLRCFKGLQRHFDDQVRWMRPARAPCAARAVSRGRSCRRSTSTTSGASCARRGSELYKSYTSDLYTSINRCELYIILYI